MWHRSSVDPQDTVKSPPSENVTMKRASFYGIGVTTIFYVSLGCIGYAAFGNAAPGNVLTGFDEPFWLVDVANVAVVIHLVGAYQVTMTVCSVLFGCFAHSMR
jgi:amino acid permease